MSIAIPAQPAWASDATLKIDRSFTVKSPDARAHWDDKTDTLCVRAYTGYASAEFARPNGAAVDIEARPRDGKVCTGNLKIREDYRTTLWLHHLHGKHGWKTKKKGFYT
ncbi:hypothetical protein BJF79_28260 [Actinomadura sp. CNU-125]|nr:hypothetical protein BJF79_28260 [Actinomadura sp. CNU-125]